ncbi:hypothetical protein TNCV_2658511 [Trichonephila clavipes]|nr:hypothetical protein TNCV_2658511 [Trichonephila clavipes]
MHTILPKKAQGLDQPSTVPLEDANAVVNHKISNQSFVNATIPELNCSRNLSSTVAILRTGYYEGMKITPDNFQS